MNNKEIGCENVNWIHPMAGCFEHDNEASGSIKDEEYLKGATISSPR
jgi:hypothetical protein